jgi:hypothetical protein
MQGAPDGMNLKKQMSTKVTKNTKKFINLYNFQPHPMGGSLHDRNKLFYLVILVISWMNCELILKIPLSQSAFP